MAKETLVGGFANIVVTSKAVVMGDSALLQNVAQTLGLPKVLLLISQSRSSGFSCSAGHSEGGPCVHRGLEISVGYCASISLNSDSLESGEGELRRLTCKVQQPMRRKNLHEGHPVVTRWEL